MAPLDAEPAGNNATNVTDIGKFINMGTQWAQLFITVGDTFLYKD